MQTRILGAFVTAAFLAACSTGRSVDDAASSPVDMAALEAAVADARPAKALDVGAADRLLCSYPMDAEETADPDAPSFYVSLLVVEQTPDGNYEFLSSTKGVVAANAAVPVQSAERTDYVESVSVTDTTDGYLAERVIGEICTGMAARITPILADEEASVDYVFEFTDFIGDGFETFGSEEDTIQLPRTQSVQVSGSFDLVDGKGKEVVSVILPSRTKDTQVDAAAADGGTSSQARKIYLVFEATALPTGE